LAKARGLLFYTKFHKGQIFILKKLKLKKKKSIYNVNKKTYNDCQLNIIMKLM